MRTVAGLRAALPVLMILALPAGSSAQVAISITVGPPALPVYEQPVCPDAGYVWTPGYWTYGSDDYYWVPGTWVLVPAPGLLWTPGYWGWGDGGYVWYPGYWSQHVGYYGGINYGYGYGGVGYQGGYWNNGAFYYNRSVNNVTNTTNITNVYNKTVINNTTNVTYVSYNGGPGGTTARPTTAELAASHEQHTPPTVDQSQHEHAASTNRAQLASVNHGQPAIVATPKPGAFTGQGVVTASRVAVPYHAVTTGAVAKGPGTPPATLAHPTVATPPRPSAPPPPKSAPPPKIQPDSKPKAEVQPKSSPPPPQHNPPPPEEKPKPEPPPN